MTEHRLNGGPKLPSAWGNERVSDKALGVLWETLKVEAPDIRSFNPRYTDVYMLVRLAREVMLARKLAPIFRKTAASMAQVGGCEQCIAEEEHDECPASTKGQIKLLLHMALQVDELLDIEGDPNA